MAEARALAENMAAVKAAEVKIASLTSRGTLDNSAVILDLRATTCTAVTQSVKLLSSYISKNPKSSEIKVTMTMNISFCCNPNQYFAEAGYVCY